MFLDAEIARQLSSAETPPTIRTPLEQLEALVLSQRSADAWRPVTDYAYLSRRAIEGPHPALIVAAFHPSVVADMGCGPGHLVRLLRELMIEATGYDRLSVHLLHPNERSWFRVLDIAGPGGFVTGVRTDLVICREVLEHLTLREIRQTITNLARSSSHFVYLTMRLHQNPQNVFDVATSDALDPTHITLPHPDLIRLLFTLEGMKRRPDLEDRLDWQHQGRCFVYEHPTDPVGQP